MSGYQSWPVNEMRCCCDGCKDTGTTPCFLVAYRHDLSLIKALFLYGLKQTWRLWQKESIEILDGFYCAEHAYKEGFCWTCGNFYAGASERFDFKINGQWFVIAAGVISMNPKKGMRKIITPALGMIDVSAPEREGLDK